MKKSLLVLSMLSALGAAPATVFAAETSAHTVTGNMTLTSDYRFRGISQTFGRPAIQGGIDYSHSSGLYLGTWASNVSGNQYLNGNGMEVDIYGGFKKELFKDFTLDVGYLEYMYPGAFYNTSAKTKYTNRELYLGTTYKWVTVKYNHTLSDFFGVNDQTYSGACGINKDGSGVVGLPCLTNQTKGSKGSGYLDLTATIPVTEKINLIAHYGSQRVKNFGGLNYEDYKLGATYDLNGWILGASYIATTADARFYRQVTTSTGSSVQGVYDTSKPTFVVSVAKTF